MALQGTLKDFGLGDIFQLIGIQRKTGILTLVGSEDTVTVKFLEGQVVGADTKRRSVEELLGAPSPKKQAAHDEWQAENPDVLEQGPGTVVPTHLIAALVGLFFHH